MKRTLAVLAAPLIVAGLFAGSVAGASAADESPQVTAAAATGFPISIVNQSGKFDDSQVWVFISATALDGSFVYLDAAGNTYPMSSLDTNGLDHLVKDGANDASMSFLLPASGTVTVPANLISARIYVSLGAELVIPVIGGVPQYPQATDVTDPNFSTHWDFYEWTYAPDNDPVFRYGGNITMVDSTDFPFTARLQQESSGFDHTVGTTKPRDQMRSEFSALGGGYAALMNPMRIASPSSSASFMQDSAAAELFVPYINNVWESWKGGFSFTEPGATFEGSVEADGLLHFTQTGIDGEGSGTISMPTTTNVFACSGTLAQPGGIGAGRLGSRICAAFNRGVAQDTNLWSTVSAYYTSGQPSNTYSAFLHENSIDGLAYGFPYDDVNSQGSYWGLPNADPPSQLTLTIGSFGSTQPTVDRVAGTDRFQTSVLVSEQSYAANSAPPVFIASGMSFPDALSIGPAAAKEKGPVLLTAPNSLSAAVTAEVSRLAPQQVVIVGGSSTVSDAVLNQVKSVAPNATVTRLSGTDRFDTSRQIVQTYFADQSGGQAVVAAGGNFPDALAAGAAIGTVSGPVLLVNGSTSTLDTATTNTLRSLDLEKAWIAGGTASVSSGIQNQLGSFFPSVERLGGTDRFQTAELINAAFFTSSDRVLLATGMTFPDALAGSAWAPLIKAPLFVVQTGCVPSGVLSQLSTLGANQVTLLGGTNTLTDGVATLTPCSSSGQN